MAEGLWRRLNRWVRRLALRLVWRVVQTRLYRYLRMVVSYCLIPLGALTTGVLAGIGIAAASGLSIGYGALIGVASAIVFFAVFKLADEIWRRIQMVNRTRRRIMAWRDDARRNVARSSRSGRRSK